MKTGLVRLLQALRAQSFHWRMDLPENGSALAVFGASTAVQTYCREFFGEQAPHVRARRVVHLAGWEHALSDACRTCGLVVVNGCPPPSGLRKKAITVPRYVRMRLAVPGDLEAYRSGLPSQAQRDLERIRKGGFSWNLSEEMGWVEAFAGRYHQPAVEARHGAAAWAESVRDMRSALQARCGEFLKVMSGDRCVAAAFCLRRHPLYVAHSFGWENGDPAMLRNGAMAAVYWFLIERAFALGCTDIDLGGVPSYLESGLLGYKAKWGARIVPEASHYPDDHLLMNPGLPGIRHFLENRSLLGRGPGSTLEVFSVRDPAEVPMRSGVRAAVSKWNRILLGDGTLEVKPVDGWEAHSG